MANKDEIENCRKSYDHMADSELIHMMHQWVPYSAMHIAAKQLLEERRQTSNKEREKLETARHIEIQKKLEELKKPHWTTKYGFWVALVAMLAACIAAYFTVFPRSSQSGSAVYKPLETKPSIHSDVSRSQRPLSSSRTESRKEK
jgi:hypothetical protein